MKGDIRKAKRKEKEGGSDDRRRSTNTAMESTHEQTSRTLVVDANAIIDGWRGWKRAEDRMVSVQEVVEELKDENARKFGEQLEVREPSAAAMKVVERWAEKTGDLRAISRADARIIALTWDLVQSYEANTKRNQTGSVRFSQANQTTQHNTEPQSTKTERNQPRKQLPGWVEPDEDDSWGEEEEEEEEFGGTPNGQESNANMNATFPPTDTQPSKEETAANTRKDKRSQTNSRKLMLEKEKEDGWERPVSANRRRRKQRKEWEKLESERLAREQAARDLRALQIKEAKIQTAQMPQGEEHRTSAQTPGEETQVPESTPHVDAANASASPPREGAVKGTIEELGDEPAVACVTADFPMQNILLHMGLPLLAPNGRRIRELHVHGLRCSACNFTTREVTRIFCPKCGNKDTLEQVPVVLVEGGKEEYGYVARHKLRGTRYSLPKPKGGRHDVQPILREDVLLARLPQSARKKKATEDVFACDFGPDTWLSDRTPRHAKGILASLDSAKRNPNERRLVRKNK